jgi:hypothetical protein
MPAPCADGTPAAGDPADTMRGPHASVGHKWRVVRRPQDAGRKNPRAGRAGLGGSGTGGIECSQFRWLDPSVGPVSLPLSPSPRDPRSGCPWPGASAAASSLAAGSPSEVRRAASRRASPPEATSLAPGSRGQRRPWFLRYTPCTAPSRVFFAGRKSLRPKGLSGSKPGIGELRIRPLRHPLGAAQDGRLLNIQSTDFRRFSTVSPPMARRFSPHRPYFSTTPVENRQPREVRRTRGRPRARLRALSVFVSSNDQARPVSWLRSARRSRPMPPAFSARSKPRSRSRFVAMRERRPDWQ